MSKNTRRAFLLGTGAVAGGLATRAYFKDAIPVGKTLGMTSSDALMLNDASELSLTAVNKHLSITQKIETTQIELLRNELTEARNAGRPVIASAARHSMGAQSKNKVRSYTRGRCFAPFE